MNAKPFTQADHEGLEARLSELVGEVCAAWRKSYGRTGHLHFGRLIPRDTRPPKAVDIDAGEFLLDLLDCDRQLTLPDAIGIIDSTVEGDDAVLGQLDGVVGTTVREASVDPADLSLGIVFADGTSLRLVTDPAAGNSDEQWALRLPAGDTIVMYGERHWQLELDS